MLLCAFFYYNETIAQSITTSSYVYVSEYDSKTSSYLVKKIDKGRAYIEISKDAKKFYLTSEMICIEGEIIEIEDVSENGDERVGMEVKLTTGNQCHVSVSRANNLISVRFAGQFRLKYILDNSFTPYELGFQSFSQLTVVKFQKVSEYQKKSGEYTLWMKGLEPGFLIINQTEKTFQFEVGPYIKWKGEILGTMDGSMVSGGDPNLIDILCKRDSGRKVNIHYNGNTKTFELEMPDGSVKFICIPE